MSALEYKLINVNNAINNLKSRIQNDLIDNLQSDINLKKNLTIAMNHLVAASESDQISGLLRMIQRSQADHVYQQFVSFINILIINLHERNELLGVCKIINNVGVVRQQPPIVIQHPQRMNLDELKVVGLKELCRKNGLETKRCSRRSDYVGLLVANGF